MEELAASPLQCSNHIRESDQLLFPFIFVLKRIRPLASFFPQMAEPISLIATIGGLSITIVKVICSISQYVDEVREASAEVQRLQNELTSFYASLGQIKLAIETPRNTPIPESWTKSFAEMLNDCEETVKMLDEIVERSKKDEKKVRAKQVWRSVKFTFKKGQADEIRKRLMSYNQLLENMFLVLAEYVS
jgi:hypothetical protein